MAPVDPLELISPLPEVREMLPAVNVLVPEIVPVLPAITMIVPVEDEFVETAELKVTGPASSFRVILPPGVDVPNVIAPPTVSPPSATIITVGPVVDLIVPVLTVVVPPPIVKLLLPKVIVLPLLLKVLPLNSVRLAGAVKLAPVVKAPVVEADPTVRFVAVMLANEAVGTLKLLDPPMLTVSVPLCGLRITVGALIVPVIVAL